MQQQIKKKNDHGDISSIFQTFAKMGFIPWCETEVYFPVKDKKQHFLPFCGIFCLLRGIKSDSNNHILYTFSSSF